MRGIWIAALIFMVPILAVADESASWGSVGLRASGISVEGSQGLVGFGASLRLKVTPKWSIEGAADFLEGDPAPSEVLSAIPVSLSAIRYLLPEAPVSLYMLGGAGLTYLRTEGIQGEFDTSRVFGHVGVGLRISVKALTFSGDLRYLVLDQNVGEPLGEGLFPETTEGGQGTFSLSYSF